MVQKGRMMNMWNVTLNLKRTSKTMRQSRTVPIHMKKKSSNHEDKSVKVKVQSRALTFICMG